MITLQWIEKPECYDDREELENLQLMLQAIQNAGRDPSPSMVHILLQNVDVL